MLKLSYMMLLAAAVPLASHADPAQPGSMQAVPEQAVSAPAAASGAASDEVATPSQPERPKARSDAPPAASQRVGAIARLRNFLVNTRTAQADFTQEVLDKNGRRTQKTSGVMHFSRPGKFRWTYLTPYEQIIVGDGEKFWLYDVDLNQVTVKKLDAALGGSPAALLAGSHEIERDFVLKDIECRAGVNTGQAASAVAGDAAPVCKDGLEWLEAKPKAADSSFEKISMAFNAQYDLVVMELRDSFGHVTVLRFANMQHNPRLPPALFKFEPPKGADVVGE